jgi:16S rRNA G966 N2-methylase RsmD
MNIIRYKDLNIYNDYTKQPQILEKIKNLLKNKDDFVSINPFAGMNKLTKINNDINKAYNTEYQLDALDFLKNIKDESVDLVIYDPPYNITRLIKYFDDLNIKRKLYHTRTQYWTFLKTEISRIIKSNGCVISIGYNSGGIGKKNGFKTVDIIVINNKTKNDIYCLIENKI